MLFSYFSAKLCKLYLVKRDFNPIALRKAKIAYNFGLSECNRVKVNGYFSRGSNSSRFSFATLLHWRSVFEGHNLLLLEEFIFIKSWPDFAIFRMYFDF